MAEILPAGTEPDIASTQKSFDVDLGESETKTWSGNVERMRVMYEGAKDASLLFGSSGVTYTESRGRGELTVASAPDAAYSDGKQELLAVDVIMPIYRAAYFAGVSTSEIAIARRLVDDGRENPDPDLTGGLAKQLFGHLLAGTTAYYETAYVLRRTYRVAAGKLSHVTVDDNNTVVSLPDLSSTINGFIDNLPTGEWLKRPTQIRSLGKNYWEIGEEYQWAPSWSVVYGGTYTGGFSA